MSVINIESWIKENESQFVPPVCNKLMHGDGQLKVMFVGGPNVRRDFHMEEGEELFFMWKGDMVLPIMEKGKPKDVVIKEGEIFVLPSRIPHSPQRLENTVGLVIERERLEDETDGLRWYRQGEGLTDQPLYEEWFHCYDLGKELKPVIERYFASDQHKSNEPKTDGSTGALVANPPIELDVTSTVPSPFSVKDWIADNASKLEPGSSVMMFEQGEFKVEVHTGPRTAKQEHVGEAWLWQYSGTGSIVIDGNKHTLSEADSTLLKTGQIADLTVDENGRCFVITMDPTANKKK